MANKKKDNKNMVIGGVCVAVVVVIVIVVAVVLAIRGNGLNDGYFVSDGTKYVLTIDNESSSSDDNDSYTPVKTHVVYTYSGDQITGMKTYGVFVDNAAAQKAYDAIKEAGEDMTNYAIDGKYIIVTANEDQYKDMKTSDVKAQIEFMESLKNMNTSETSNTSDANSGETVEVKETEEQQ